MNLNLGCGNDIKESWVNVDLNATQHDIKHDLNKFPYPFKSHTADKVLFSHILEHLDDPIKSINEAVRILKKEGELIIFSPHYSHYSAYSTEHKRYFNSYMLNAWVLNTTQGNQEKGKLKIQKIIFKSNIPFVSSLLNINQKLTEVFLCKLLPINQFKIIARRVIL